MFFDVNHSNILFDPPPRIKTVETQINQGDRIILTDFCRAKETVQKIKRQLPEWETIFVNDSTNKGLMLRPAQQVRAEVLVL